TEGDGPVRHELVIRVEPSAHTLYYDAPRRFHQQAQLLRVLGERTELPVARIRFVEDDPSVLGSPFFAMDRIAGQPVPDLPPYNQLGWLHDATPEQQRRLWCSTVDQLAAVHRVDWRRLGIDLGATGTAAQLDYFADFYGWARGERTYPVIEATGAWLRAHL